MTRRVLVRLALACAMVLTFAAPPAGSSTALAAGTSTGCLPGLLKSRLAQIRRKFGGVRVISTHRPGARIAGSGRRSYHASCRAVDFHPPRGKYRAVVAWLKANHGGGVGTYSCGMHHIHIDNGPRVRFHHCVNRAGVPQRRHASRRRNRKRSAKYTARRRYATTARRATNTRSRKPWSRAQRPDRSAQPEGRRLKSARYMRQLTQSGS